MLSMTLYPFEEYNTNMSIVMAITTQTQSSTMIGGAGPSGGGPPQSGGGPPGGGGEALGGSGSSQRGGGNA